MKKSELIEKLQAIDGDPEIGFIVNNDLFDDDSYFTYLDSIGSIKNESLAIRNENIYETFDICDLQKDIENSDLKVTSDEALNIAKQLYKNILTITLSIKWRNV